MDSKRALKVSQFQKKVLSWYKKNPRAFPWRETRDPYRIFLSEIMLQQTQTERVRAYYDRFLGRFPTVEHLAQAHLQEVLKEWQGLGYNRRGIALHRAAQEIVTRFNGIVPSGFEELCALPGVGAYTASAIRAFAFGEADVVLETNIRTVYTVEFFSKRKALIRDDEIRALIAESVHKKDPRTWYYALMDYGVALKREHRGINSRSASYRKQSKFQGSRREVRGKILKLLHESSVLSLKKLETIFKDSSHSVSEVVESLVREGFVKKRNGAISF